jgi:hypothetical protein
MPRDLRITYADAQVSEIRTWWALTHRKLVAKRSSSSSLTETALGTRAA